MRPFLIALTLLFSLSSVTGAETTSIYKSTGSVSRLVEQYVELPDILKNADVKVTITAFPKQRYYKTEIRLLRPYDKVCSFNKTLEIWDDKRIVKTSVDIDLDFRLLVIKRIVEPRVEQAILDAEKKFLEHRLTK